MLVWVWRLQNRILNCPWSQHGLRIREFLVGSGIFFIKPGSSLRKKLGSNRIKITDTVWSNNIFGSSVELSWMLLKFVLQLKIVIEGTLSISHVRFMVILLQEVPDISLELSNGLSQENQYLYYKPLTIFFFCIL